jgi:AraC family transcriptional regulator of adaptative response / DNA-3-methyladenine glycosylase II
MRALGDPASFLPHALEVRRAAERLGLDASPCRLEVHAESWRPWRAHAVPNIWESLSVETDTLPHAV